MGVADYNLNPDLNTTINGINIAEDCPPSGINNAIRQLMADVKADKDEQDSEIATAQSAADAAQSAADAAQSAADSNVKTVNGNAPDAAGNVLLGTENGIVPVGSVIAFAADSAPSGYLLCNGAAVSRETYAALFSAIGTTYGKGDGSTTFNLPDLTDRFIQGSGTAGTVKSAGLPNITGEFLLGGNDVLMGFGKTSKGSGALSSISMGDTGYTAQNTSREFSRYKIGFSARGSNTIYSNSTTVQPPALTMRYYIKY